MGKLIERTALLNKLLALRGTPDIKIITGIRRSGKSELMRSFLQRVSATASSKTNVLYIDLTDMDNEALCEYHALYAFIRERHAPDAENVLCIDEVQMCPGFERAVNSLHSKGEWDIYLTGSNAFMLSSDLATLFTGRYIEVHVLPFSFREYRTFFGFGSRGLHEQLDAYVRDGGMAGTYAYPDESIRMAYLRSVYETIANRDLVQKRNITNKAAFAALVDYLVDNIGNLSSANKIANTLKTEGRPSSHVTVANNMRYLCEAFLFYRVKRYDIQGRRYLETNDKYYLVDTSFRRALIGTRNMDWGRLYENIVAIELIRRGWEIYVGKLYQKEIDFVALRGSRKAYIQVSDNISDPATFQREVDPLLKIKDAYPKMVIANTRHEPYDHQGVQILDIAQWLADEDS